MQMATKKSGVEEDLKSLPMSELQAKLGSSPNGLSQAETQKRLTQYGPNEIEEKKTKRDGNPLVTGAADKGTWVHLLHPPTEGRPKSGFEGLDVGHLLRVPGERRC